MADLYGKPIDRAALSQSVGDMSQVARVRAYRLADGYEAGTLAVDIATGSGFQFTVVPDRGMDISLASLNGHSLAWRSAQTDRNPAHYEPAGLGWLRSFPGGLVTTCGLTWHGAPSVDDGKELGLHGRISNTPATNVQWDAGWMGDDYILSVAGKLREAIIFGENIEMRRRIWARAGESCLHIEDTVENLGYQTTPLMMLYHCNFGYPVVDAGSYIAAPSTNCQPRDADAADGAEQWDLMDSPTPGYREKCYFHTMAAGPSGTATVAIVNPACDSGNGLGAYVRYRPDQLPLFTHWKMMGQGNYVTGLEPCNALVMGRDAERKAGRLQHLEPGESRTFQLELGAAVGRAALAEIENTARGIG